MESWCFDSADKFYSSNETVSSCNSIPRTKNVLKGFKFNDPFIYQTNLLIPNQQIASANPSFSQVALPEISNAQLPNLEETNIVNPCVITPDTISGEDESSLKLSSSIMNSKIHESCQFDLKLGAFSTKPSSNSSKSPPISSPLESSMPLKKAYCQVYGCGKDLSSAREYYKRHRVCEAHSKTSMVIVNGIKQRFCQQCSRFHLVSEFDDSKRSCRKRLAGHNERRRKPQVGYNSSRNGRSLHSFSASFTSHKSNGFTSIERYKQMNDWGRHLKVEDGAEYVEKSEVTCINEDPHQKAIILASSDCGNKYPCFMSKRNKCVRNEHLTVFDEASNGEVLGSISLSDPGVALSLLSRGSPYYGKPACSDLGSQIPHPSL